MIKTKNQFDIDVTLNGGYLYTESGPLSSSMANTRLTKATIDTVVLSGKKVLEIGCGDGYYTNALQERLKPKEMIGIDISPEAIKIAQNKYGSVRGLQFLCKDIYELKKSHFKADCAIVRGVIHHVEDPFKAISTIAALAPEILIIEPNGYNPILKIIEKISPYHRMHEEKSYAPFQLRRWLAKSGYKKIIDDQYINIVPFFFPDMGARFLKAIEPTIEALPLISRVMCGVYVVHASRFPTKS